MSKNKRKKPFLQTNTGRLLVTSMIIIIVTAFVLSLLPFANNDTDYEAAESEWQNIQSSIQILKENANPPIENLVTDERIERFVSAQSEATDIMTDGGLIDIANAYIASGSIVALNQVLGLTQSRYKYWFEMDGTLQQVIP